jgi:hypothetical protein
MGAIDEASIKQLSFITQLAKSVHIRSDGHDEVPSRACTTALSVHQASVELPVQASDFEKCFPHFLWVLRDFALKVGSEGTLHPSPPCRSSPLTPFYAAPDDGQGRQDIDADRVPRAEPDVRAWGLRGRDDAEPRPADAGAQIVKRSHRAGCVELAWRGTQTTFFKNRDCFALQRPVTDEQELSQLTSLGAATSLRPGFEAQANALRQLVHSTAAVRSGAAQALQQCARLA